MKTTVFNGTTRIDSIARRIVGAIINGRHTRDIIIKYLQLETEYREVSFALAILQQEGIIEYHNRNMANEYGYFITDEGWNMIH